MLMCGTDVLCDAATRRTAVAGFVAYNLEMAQGVVEAAERSELPVVLQAGSGPFKHAGWTLATIALSLAQMTDADVGVHLGHSKSLDEIEICLRLGYTSVMADFAHLPFDDNITLTREAAKRSHDYGAWIEARVNNRLHTAEFVGLTGIDMLAVSVHNDSDVDGLRALRKEAGIPLALDDAAEVAADTLLDCLDHGVAKVNVDAQLRRAFLTAQSDAVPDALRSDDITKALGAGREAVATTAARIALLLARSS